MKKMSYTIATFLAIGGAVYGLVSWGLGPETSILAKCFLTFFGALVVLQIVPAALLFSCMIKEMIFHADTDDEQDLVIETQGENSAR